MISSFASEFAHLQAFRATRASRWGSDATRLAFVP